MMAINKVVASAREAVADIPDGATIAIAGFGFSHAYPELVPALLERGTTRLAVVANSLGGQANSLATLIENHRVRKLLISISSRADEQIASGEIDVELVPQGTLVERLRAGGTGIAGFFTRTGVGTLVAQGKETRRFGDEEYLLEESIRPDFSFVRARRADRFGNLEFAGVGRNFHPAFAKAGKVVIAEVDEIVEGAIDPEKVGLPGIFVTRVVQQGPQPPFAPPRPRKKRAEDVPLEYNGKPGRTREQMAAVVATLLPEGSYVNLGLGMPTLVSNHIGGRDIVLHSENGMLGYGAHTPADRIDPDVYNAGSGFVELEAGASFFDSVTSFEMVRGGQVNVVVLGGLQVDEDGNLANWATSDRHGGTIGGAMDLAAGGASVVVMMTHLAGENQKLVKRCTFPLTGVGCVDVVVTDLCVLRRVDGRFRLESTAPGFTPEEVAVLTELSFEY
jgi:3-oxoacid CoA-transferase